MLGHFRTRATAMYGINVAREALRLDVPWPNEEILDTSHQAPNELSSKHLYSIYKERGVGGAAVMQLIEVGSFWLHHSVHGVSTKVKTYATTNYQLVAAAASHIATQGKTLNNKETVTAIAERCAENVSSRSDYSLHI